MAGEPKQFVIYKDVRGEWRWQLFAANARQIADSAEGYRNKADCVHGARLVAGVSSGAGIWNRVTGLWE